MSGQQPPERELAMSLDTVQQHQQQDDDGNQNETRPPHRAAAPVTRRRQTNPKQKQETKPPTVVTFYIPPTIRQRVSREWIVRVSVETMCRHLMYSRGLWPLPALQVEAWNPHQSKEHSVASSSDESSKSSSVNQQKLRQQCQLKTTAFRRKLSLAQTTLVQFLEDVTWMIEEYSTNNHSISYVVVSLGPSWSRAKEGYVLDLGNMDADADSLPITTLNGNNSKAESDTIHNSLEHTFSRRLLRDAMMVIDEQTAPPSKMVSSFHLCITFGLQSVEHDSTFPKTDSSLLERGFGDENKDPRDAGNHESCAADQTGPITIDASIPAASQPPPQLIVRRGTTLASMQASCSTPMSTVCLTTTMTTNGTSVTTTSPLHSPAGSDQLVWISLRSVVKGFR